MNNTIKTFTLGNGVFIYDENCTIFVSKGEKVLINRNCGHQFYYETSLSELTFLVNSLKNQKGVTTITPTELLNELEKPVI